ncbi:MAG: hypothetical protein IKV03_04410, partial [Alphaproteobacteria bacterium]|nr:hypothetical protein [Alphaproteobacteria bacterium]
EGDAYFSISNVPQSVCEMVYEGIQNNQTTKVEVNGTSAEDASACNKEEDNTMGFFFITNAGEGGTTPEDLCKNKTCPEGYSCTHGICMSEEPPRFATAYKCCNNDSMCGVCYYCSKEWGEDGYSGNCTAHADGTKCGEGTCQQGVCIADKECSDHSECDPGFYCDISMTPNKCIQAEFHKVVLKDINETVYISNRSQGFVGDNFNIEPDLFCELNGFSLISEEHFLSASFLDAFKNTISSNAPFCVSGEKSCFKGGDCMNGWMGYTICVDK